MEDCYSAPLAVESLAGVQVLVSWPCAESPGCTSPVCLCMRVHGSLRNGQPWTPCFPQWLGTRHPNSLFRKTQNSAYTRKNHPAQLPSPIPHGPHTLCHTVSTFPMVLTHFLTQCLYGNPPVPPFSPPGHSRVMATLQSPQYPLLLLLHRYPKLVAQLQKMQVDMMTLAQNWLAGCYVGILPNRVVMQIMDCMLIDGSMVLFRCARGPCPCKDSRRGRPVLEEEAFQRGPLGERLGTDGSGCGGPGQPLLNRHQVGGVSRSPDGLFAQQEREPIRGRPAVRGKRTYGGRPGQRVEDQGTWASRTQKHSEAGYGRPVDRGAWTAKTVKRPRQQPAHPQYANYWAPLTRKRHTMPHSAQPQQTNCWAPRTRKRHQQEHRLQRPTESSNPTQHAKGRTGDFPGPREGATTRRNVTQGVRTGSTTRRECVGAVYSICFSCWNPLYGSAPRIYIAARMASTWLRQEDGNNKRHQCPHNVFAHILAKGGSWAILWTVGWPQRKGIQRHSLPGSAWAAQLGSAPPQTKNTRVFLKQGCRGKRNRLLKSSKQGAFVVQLNAGVVSPGWAPSYRSVRNEGEKHCSSCLVLGVRSYGLPYPDCGH